MTKGDIIAMPSGRLAQYVGGTLGQGAEFVYVDAQGKPVKHRGEPETVCIGSTRLLAKLQPEGQRV